MSRTHIRELSGRSRLAQCFVVRPRLGSCRHVAVDPRRHRGAAASPLSLSTNDFLPAPVNSALSSTTVVRCRVSFGRRREGRCPSEGRRACAGPGRRHPASDLDYRSKFARLKPNREIIKSDNCPCVSVSVPRLAVVHRCRPAR